MAAPSQQVCISSFGDRMVFGEVSPYSTHDAMLYFFRRLVSLGVDVELASNDHDLPAERSHDGAGDAKNRKESQDGGKEQALHAEKKAAKKKSRRKKGRR